jgi:hypothetical protein
MKNHRKESDTPLHGIIAGTAAAIFSIHSATREGVVWAFGLAAGGRLLGIGADRLAGTGQLATIGRGCILRWATIAPRPTALRGMA